MYFNQIHNELLLSQSYFYFNFVLHLSNIEMRERVGFLDQLFATAVESAWRVGQEETI
jgi:hypothetical protein